MLVVRWKKIKKCSFCGNQNTVELIQEVKILMSAFAARTLKMDVATCLKEKGKQVPVMHFFLKKSTF
jgi:hypothetical protein